MRKERNLEGDEMMTDKELMTKIEEIIRDYEGDISYLNEAIGMVVVGRLVGWEHQRIVTTRKCWLFATKLFGDPKSPELMPKRGDYAYKSYALELADRVGGWVKIFTRKVYFPMHEIKVMKGLQ